MSWFRLTLELPRSDRPSTRLAVWALVLFALFFSTGLKLYYTTGLATYSFDDDTGLFWTESALHYGYAKRVAEGESLPAVDLRAQHPEGAQVRTHLMPVMELAAGHAYRLYSRFWPGRPFHYFLIHFVALVSSLSVLAVYLQGRDLWGSRWSGLLAAAFYATAIPSFSRTIGNYLKEDFALPWLLLSVTFFLRAVRRPSWHARTLAGGFLVLGLTSWHGAQFFFGVVLTFGLAWYVGRREPDFRFARELAWLVGWAVLAGLLSPALRSRLFVLSPLMVVGYGVLVLFALESRWLWMMRRHRLAALGLVVGAALLPFGPGAWSRDYAHVSGLLFYKLRFLGQRPADPLSVPYEARSLWMPPFLSPTAFHLTYEWGILLGLAGIAVTVVVLSRRRLGDHLGVPFLLFLTGIYLALFLMVERLAIFLVPFLAVWVGVFVARERLRLVPAGVLVLGLLAVQTHEAISLERPTLLRSALLRMMPPPAPPLSVYSWERRGLIEWVRNHTEPSDVFLSNFPLGSTIFTYADRPIVLHSKFEEAALRRKVRLFLDAVYGDEEDLYVLARAWGVKYVVAEADLITQQERNWYLYLAGRRELAPASPAARFFTAPETLSRFALAYQGRAYRVFAVR